MVGGKKNGLSIWINMLVRRVGKIREVERMMNSRRQANQESSNRRRQGKGKPREAW